MQAQWSKAQTDIADLKAQLVESQNKLEKAEADLALLKKPPARK